VTLFRALAAIVAIVLIAAGAWFGRKVPVAEQWPMFEALRTTAAIIFAVIGAWMAIIYPERLKLSFRPADTASPADLGPATGWGQLFTPVVHSTLILGVVLLLGITVPVLKHAGLAVPVDCWRGTSYGVLVALTLWQLWTVLLTLVPADKVKSSLDSSDARATTLAGMMAVGQRQRPPPPGQD
jgi:hypothetical protein